MKIKTKLILSIALMAFLDFRPAYSDIITMEAIVNSDALNIRQSNTTTSNILTSVKKGTKLKIVGIDDEKVWYKVDYNGKIGWVDKKYTQTDVLGDSNYKVVSSLGNINNSGVIYNGIKSTVNNKYRYVLDFSEKAFLKIFDKNNDFVSSIPINYSWAYDKKDFDSIVLAADDNSNFYTNSQAKNIITKYDEKGTALSTISSDLLGDVSFISFNNTDKILYSLDAPSKTIKGFDSQGLNSKNIFLSETRVPKSFSFNKNNIYVLDYPENAKEYYSVYYVDTYSYELKNNYDLKSKTVESPAKGSILKNNPNGKTYKTKVFIDKDQTKVKEVNWIDFSDGVKKFGISEDLKKADVLGDIDIYKNTGEYLSNITLNDNWTIKSPDRHKVNENSLIRELKGIIFNNNSLVIPVISLSKGGGFSSLNYYSMDIQDKSYKVSQAINFDSSKGLTYFSDNNNIYTSVAKGSFIGLSENGIEKEKLGIKSSNKFNMAYKIDFAENKLNVFDKSSYSIGSYDLNGEALKVVSREQKSDLFNYEDVFFAKDKTYILKSISVEDKKIGIDIYDNKINKIYDKWLITISPDSAKPKISASKEGNIFIYAKGFFYNRKSVLSMFNDRGYLINNWEKETELARTYDEDPRKLIRENSIKFFGFDKDGNTYISLSTRGGQYKIHKLKINQEGRGKLLKVFETDFFGDLTLIEDEATKTKINKRKFAGSFNGQVLGIEEGKQGFTYFMVKDNITREVRLGIFDSIGDLWKEVPLNNYPDISGFSLDTQDNIWVSQGTSLRKFANYK